MKVNKVPSFTSDFGRNLRPKSNIDCPIFSVYFFKYTVDSTELRICLLEIVSKHFNMQLIYATIFKLGGKNSNYFVE